MSISIIWQCEDKIELSFESYRSDCSEKFHEDINKKSDLTIEGLKEKTIGKGNHIVAYYCKEELCNEPKLISHKVRQG